MFDDFTPPPAQPVVKPGGEKPRSGFDHKPITEIVTHIAWFDQEGDTASLLDDETRGRVEWVVKQLKTLTTQKAKVRFRAHVDAGLASVKDFAEVTDFLIPWKSYGETEGVYGHLNPQALGNHVADLGRLDQERLATSTHSIGVIKMQSMYMGLLFGPYNKSRAAFAIMLGKTEQISPNSNFRDFGKGAEAIGACNKYFIPCYSIRDAVDFATIRKLLKG